MTKGNRLQVLLLCCTAFFTLVGSASARFSGTGGASAPEMPKVETADCGVGTAWVCAPNTNLTLKGEGLDNTKVVIFLGAAGRKDDYRIRPLVRKASVLKVNVPPTAASGPLKIVSSYTKAVVKTPSLEINSGAVNTLDIDNSAVFPIKGKYEIGKTATQRFGGARGHEGQDIFAECGTPLVAAQGGTVQFVGVQSAAGNYLVVKRPDGTSYAYMHLREAPVVVKGDVVTPGQPVGNVGDTGDAQGCHLHFELWTAPGWYEGGQAIDPLPTLQGWAKQ